MIVCQGSGKPTVDEATAIEVADDMLSSFTLQGDEIGESELYECDQCLLIISSLSSSSSLPRWRRS